MIARPAILAPSAGRRQALRLLEWLAIAGLLFYCGWWGYWLAAGRLPPAILLAATGLPCPTTGFTRSLLALLNGHWLASLCWNPLAIPIALLLATSLATLAVRRWRGQPLRLPTSLAWAWAGVLMAAWVAKFLLGPAWW